MLRIFSQGTSSDNVLGDTTFEIVKNPQLVEY